MAFSQGRPTVRKNQSFNKTRSRRKDRNPSFVRRVVRWTVVLGVVVICLVGVWGFERVESVVANLTSVQQISIMGLKTLQREDILSELSLTPETSLFDIEPDVMMANLETHPWIRTASLQRVFPHTLAIRIVEREPAAILQSSKTRYLLDDQAQILSLVEETQHADLPILRGVSSTFPTVRDPARQQQIRDGIQVGHLLARAFDEVPTVNVGTASMIVASIKALRFQFGDSIEAQWQRFQTLSPSIQEQMTREATEVDLRYAGKVILRKRE